MTQPRTHSPAAPSGTVAVASFIGTTIEWYDFFLYGTAAALVFNRLFFPTFDPLTGTLAAFGTYAVGFVARPIGGIVIGHYGDKIGRKSMLVLTLVDHGRRDVPDRPAADLRADRPMGRRSRWCCCASRRDSASAANGAARC